MIAAVNILLLVASIAAVAIATMLALEIAASRTTRRPRKAREITGTPRMPVAVIVPAHNESTAMKPTLDSIARQLHPADRIVVVADNCSDDTAAIARGFGAEVVERHDLNRIGKGYALDAGVRHLAASSPPGVAIIIDADCTLADGTIDVLTQTCALEQRPVQALYLMNATSNAGPRERIAAFAWRIKNKVRPLGLNALSMPCLLTGAGMAFPMDLLRQLNLATGHITEDTFIAVECALRGRPPLLAPDALVTSEFAPTDQSRSIQKSRWVHGHLSAIIELVPKLLANAVRRRDIRSLMLALEIAIPPLALLLAGLILLTSVTGIWYLATGHAPPFALSLTASVLAAVAIALAWMTDGRDLVRGAELREIARYTARQLPIARNFIAGRRSEWTRSERGPSNHESR